MHYLFLVAAILLECGGTFLMKLSNGFAELLPSVGCLVLYAACFAALAKALEGIALNIAYATWCGVGIILATSISVFIFKETMNLPVFVGIVLIVVGVVLVNYFGSAH
ncbi:MAG: QacE family quaternary ammonium compound efflux SMR transporter [Eggerthellaceae bacterium]|nr:QacE family quaternary ammonium compound efflux SMR transporter [Eggerthellaceae bacterium]